MKRGIEGYVGRVEGGKTQIMDEYWVRLAKGCRSYRSSCIYYLLVKRRLQTQDSLVIAVYTSKVLPSFCWLHYAHPGGVNPSLIDFYFSNLDYSCTLRVLFIPASTSFSMVTLLSPVTIPYGHQ